MSEATFKAVLPVETKLECTLSEFITSLADIEKSESHDTTTASLQLFLNDTEIIDTALRLGTKICAYRANLESNDEPANPEEANSFQAEANELWELVQARHFEAIHLIREFTKLQIRNYYSTDGMIPTSVVAAAFFLLTGTEVTS